mgnify:CR=1 FL=1
MGLVVIHALIFGVAPSPPPAPLFVSTNPRCHHHREGVCDSATCDRKKSDRARTNYGFGKRQISSCELFRGEPKRINGGKTEYKEQEHDGEATRETTDDLLMIY